MTDRLITHLRHVDFAVPDYDTQVEFYRTTWGLTQVEAEDGLTFFAAEGSPEQYVIRLRRSGATAPAAAAPDRRYRTWTPTQTSAAAPPAPAT